MSGEQPIELAYVDIQHDALAVFDDVEQHVVTQEDIWISAYKKGESSVHGKARIEPGDGPQASITARDGVRLERVTPSEHEKRADSDKSSFLVSVPSFDIDHLPISFPKQVVKPPYSKASSVSPELTVNALAYSAIAERLLVAGSDGYLAAIPTSRGVNPERDTVTFKGHVGDVLSVRIFPSGQVALTTSTDLSIRIWSMAGQNPRTLTGHTRAVTCTAILDVGKEIFSGSKDGTIRQWHVGDGREITKWETQGRSPVLAIFVLGKEDLASMDAAQGGDANWALLAITQEGVIEVFTAGVPGTAIWRIPKTREARVVSVAYNATTGLLATGHTNGVVHIRAVRTLRPANAEDGDITTTAVERTDFAFRRNESSVASLAWQKGDLLVGTEAGLPCKLVIDPEGQQPVRVKEEMAGWEPVGVNGWAAAEDTVWCAGAEGGIRRY